VKAYCTLNFITSVAYLVNSFDTLLNDRSLLVLNEYNNFIIKLSYQITASFIYNYYCIWTKFICTYTDCMWKPKFDPLSSQKL